MKEALKKIIFIRRENVKKAEARMAEIQQQLKKAQSELEQEKALLSRAESANPDSIDDILDL